MLEGFSQNMQEYLEMKICGYYWKINPKLGLKKYSRCFVNLQYFNIVADTCQLYFFENVET